jgi:hypothetical protein
MAIKLNGPLTIVPASTTLTRQTVTKMELGMPVIAVQIQTMTVLATEDFQITPVL